MDLRWTEWTEDHIARHGVTWGEVVEAMAAPTLRRSTPNHDAWVFLGETFGGRRLALLVSRLDLGFVVTARDMNDEERRRYRLRISKEGQIR